MSGHKAWLEKAKHDLESAKLLAYAKINDMAIYHAHQTMEKCLKAFLVFKRHTIPRTHDLMGLLEVCCRFDANLLKVEPLVETLDPFGAWIRYPCERPEPGNDVVADAVSKAEALYNYIQNAYP